MRPLFSFLILTVFVGVVAYGVYADFSRFVTLSSSGSPSLNFLIFALVAVGLILAYASFVGSPRVDRARSRSVAIHLMARLTLILGFVASLWSVLVENGISSLEATLSGAILGFMGYALLLVAAFVVRNMVSDDKEEAVTSSTARSSSRTSTRSGKRDSKREPTLD